MDYDVKFQTEEKYRSILYGNNSIYNSGCGPTSLCNALKALRIADVGIETMCKLAVSCGARVSNGTDMSVLLKSLSNQYDFEYHTTSLNAELLEHLKIGGAAIMNQGSAYSVFSNGGHFVAAVAASGETIIVLDSYWNDSKYVSWPEHHAKRTTQMGVVTATLTQCGKATIDRSPSYYLISKVEPTATTTDSVTARTGAGKVNAAVGTIDKDVTLTVLDSTTNWIQTAVWIAKKYCTISGRKAKLTADVNARASNGTNSAKLGILNKGMSLEMLEQTENWVKVPVWVAKKYTK